MELKKKELFVRVEVDGINFDVIVPATIQTVFQDTAELLVACNRKPYSVGTVMNINNCVRALIEAWASGWAAKTKDQMKWVTPQ